MSTSAVADQFRRAQYILDGERIAQKVTEVRREPNGVVLIQHEGGGAYALDGLPAEWVWRGPAAVHTHSLIPDDGKELQALALAVADILRNDPDGPGWTHITPWPENLAVPILAGDTRVLLNGRPPLVPVRILSEEHYQIARAAVNALAQK